MMMASLAAAQDYPVRAVSIVVPYGPGSYTDNVIRPIAVALQKELGQPVVIDNRAGANGVIGSQFAARAKADGYTLLAGSSTTLAANVGLYKSLPYDPLKDFVPVAGVAATSMMFMVRADFAAQDLKGFLAHAAKQTQPAIVDVSNGVPHLKSGKLLALAISGARRATAAPEVPTLAEVFPGTQFVTWIGLVAPTGTSPQVVDKLSQATAKVLAAPETLRQLAALATDPEPMSAQEMGRRMQRDQAQWLELMREAGIQPE